MFNRQIGAKGILGRGFPDGLAAETASHYSGEFRSPISRWGLSGKLRPTLERQNGMGFPIEVYSGKPIPESAAETGHDFPNGPLAETASRNRHSDWDVFSRSSPSGKLRPGICARNGTRFPQGPNQPPAPRQNHPLSSVVCGTSKECPRVPAIGTSPAAGSISPQLQKPARAIVVTCAGLVGAHKGTLQRPTSVMDYRTAPARDASVGVPSDEACHSPRQSAQCRQSADTAK